VEDFNYEILNKELFINIILKIDGLKEIEPYFLTQNSQEIIEINQDEIYDELSEEEPLLLNQQEDTNIINNQPSYSFNHSLLTQIFKRKKSIKESTYLFHVIKDEISYEDIAKLYNVDVNILKSINNDAKLYPGKLILIPRNT
jgi:hypothetical protein